MKILLCGPKSSGKTEIGKQLAEKLGLEHVDTDSVLEKIYVGRTGEQAGFREIYRTIGADAFRELEAEAVASCALQDWVVLSCGGGTMFKPELRRLLQRQALIIVLQVAEPELWRRIEGAGVPPFYEGADGREKHRQRVADFYEIMEPRADLVFSCEQMSVEQIASALEVQVEQLITTRDGAPNTFGELVRVTTFGESHGPAVGCVLDGVPAGVPFDREIIQHELDRRRPGQSSVTTPRNEADQVRVLSGVFEGKTTGAPICMIVENRDQDSSKYDNLRDIFRPGHADFTFNRKFGIRDHRGGGRSSGRETIGRVASGALALHMLREKGVQIIAWAEEIAGIAGTVVDTGFIEKNPVRAADPAKAPLMEKAVLDASAAHDSVGGVVGVRITGVPAGLGDPVFAKLDARLAGAMFSLGAVKGVEIGAGFAAAKMTGSENNDQMGVDGFCSNNAGGILGGISNGSDILLRIAVKPTPSIFRPQQTVDLEGTPVEVEIAGRHDPCIVPRIIPVVESMCALVLLDAWFLQQSRQGGGQS